MPKYLFAYHGGGAPTNPEDQKKVMDAWGAWFGTLGRAVIDGGNPVGPSSTVKPDRSCGLERCASKGQRLPAAEIRRNDRDRAGLRHVAFRRPHHRREQ